MSPSQAPPVGSVKDLELKLVMLQVMAWHAWWRGSNQPLGLSQNEMHKAALFAFFIIIIYLLHTFE